MQALSASGLLALWEEGLGQKPVEQALILLCAAFPERSPVELARLTIGQRDALLLRLREQTFGTRLTGLSACPQCGERIETSFTANELLGNFPTPQEEKPLAFEDGNFKVTFRLPSSLDLQAASTREALLAACVLEAQRDQTPIEPASLPEAIAQAIAARMEEADPLANITLPITCPACGHHWQSLFDITAFFWSEINAWAVRILHEVHILASAYGWREADILAMSAWRRQRYIEMVGA